jgi:hypothetical protein
MLLKESEIESNGSITISLELNPEELLEVQYHIFTVRELELVLLKSRGIGRISIKRIIDSFAKENILVCKKN